MLFGRMSSGHMEEDRDGVVFQLLRSRVRRNIFIFPESGLEEVQLIVEAFVLTPSLKERLVCWRDSDVVQGSGRGLYR
jgi:hypothetical protein